MVLVNSLLELVEGRRHLQSLEQDSLLTLNTNIFWPPDEAGQVSLGLDVASNSEVFGVLFEERAVILL